MHYQLCPQILNYFKYMHTNETLHMALILLLLLLLINKFCVSTIKFGSCYSESV